MPTRRMQPLHFHRPPARILVLSTPGFGDVLVATPLLRSLRHAWPEAAIDVMVHRGREAMLAGNPDVRRAIPVPKRTGPLAFLRVWAATIGRYDLAIAPMSGDRGVFLLRCAARRCVTAFRGLKRKDWWKRAVLTAWTTPEASDHQVQRHLQLADLLGIERRYEFTAPRDPDAPRRLDEAVPFDWRTEPYVVVHPTTHATRKRWTVEGWSALARAVGDRGWRGVVTGGPADDPAYLDELVKASDGRFHSVAGALDLAAVRALVEGARAYVGVDTSTTHLAAALGVPTLAIYGPGEPDRWSPWPRGYAEDRTPFHGARGATRVGNVCLVQADCECGARYRAHCGVRIPGRSRCLEELPAETVVAAFGDLLAAAGGA